MTFTLPITWITCTVQRLARPKSMLETFEQNLRDSHHTIRYDVAFIINKYLINDKWEADECEVGSAQPNQR